jgi:hypothetical protein
MPKRGERQLQALKASRKQSSGRRGAKAAKQRRRKLNAPPTYTPPKAEVDPAFEKFEKMRSQDKPEGAIRFKMDQASDASDVAQK